MVGVVVLGPQTGRGGGGGGGRGPGRARAYVRQLTSELDREAEGFDLRRDLDAAQRAFREGTSAVKDDLRKLTDAAARGDEPPKP
jgi:sec-independent protein translocase protein TatB